MADVRADDYGDDHNAALRPPLPQAAPAISTAQSLTEPPPQSPMQPQPSMHSQPPTPPPPAGAMPTSEKNWAGVASIILACLGGGLLGLIFGIIGLSAAKEGRATNRKMALWGTILNAAIPVAIFGTAMVVSGIATLVSGESSTQLGRLAAGDCVMEPRGWSDSDGLLDSEYVSVVACDEPHWAQLAYRTQHSADSFPGAEALDRWAETVCFSDAVATRVRPEVFDQAYVTWIMPSAESWRYGDRTVLCFVSGAGETTTGDWIDSGAA